MFQVEASVDVQSSGTALSIRDLGKRFPAKQGWRGQVTEWFDAVADVSLELPAGKTLGIVGESGSGKTTLGKCIVGLLRPSSGTVFYQGRDLSSGTMDITTRLSVQMVHQGTGSALDPRMKIRHAVAEGLHQVPGLKRAAIGDRVVKGIESVGLRAADLDRYPHMFSGGQRQRIVIARAIVLDPSLLVLDEPTSALDVSIQVKILNLLKTLQEALKLTYVLISHDIRTIEAMSDSIAVMYLGRLVEWGPTEQVLKNPIHPYTAHLIASVPAADPAQRIGDGRSASASGGSPSTAGDATKGCAYRRRCPLAEAACAETRPPLIEVGPDHFGACPPASRLRAGPTRVAEGSA